MKKGLLLLLCLIILFSTVFTAGCSKKTSIDVAALANVLCFFDKSELEVIKIEKMAMFRDEDNPWYVYKIFVTVHLDDGDVDDVLGIIFDPEDIIPNRPFYDSEKEISYNEHSPSAGTAFVIWEMMENDHKNAEISEIPEKDIPQIVSQAWMYIEENNVHPEEDS